MKKKLLLAACLFMIAASAFAGQFKKGQTLYVSTKTVTLKDGSGNFAKNVGTLTYGDQVKVLAVSGSKVQVQLSTNSKTSGWVTEGSLTKKKITKTSSGGKVSASTKELALAGKGFDEESEGVYAASHSNLNFDLVDRIESINVSDYELEKFISEGHLKGADE
ncbi:MAG: hypothetical protein IIU15_06955 [Treponema sp.]|nr:hypothetical protein [Treponema sp.]